MDTLREAMGWAERQIRAAIGTKTETILSRLHGVGEEERGDLRARMEVLGDSIIECLRGHVDQVDTWRPVSEPPELRKDKGGQVLASASILAVDADGHMTSCWCGRSAEAGTEAPTYWYAKGFPPGLFHPTHWRPLPEGPK